MPHPEAEGLNTHVRGEEGRLGGGGEADRPHAGAAEHSGVVDYRTAISRAS